MDQEVARQLAASPGARPFRKFEPAFRDQLGPLATRQLRELYRHPLSLLLNLVATLGAAIGLGVIFGHAGRPPRPVPHLTPAAARG